jgi:hypothetical protein
VPKLIIEKLPPYDGSYPLDVGAFTGRELHTIKQISGVRAGELADAFEAADYDLVVAFTVIVLQRAGKTVNPDDILDAEIGSITVEMDDATEVVERPPTSPPTSGSESSSGGQPNNSDGSITSGSPSNDDGGQPLRILGPTGKPSSESVESNPETEREASAI